jgi:hypothetical protein
MSCTPACPSRCLVTPSLPLPTSAPFPTRTERNPPRDPLGRWAYRLGQTLVDRVAGLDRALEQTQVGRGCQSVQEEAMAAAENNVASAGRVWLERGAEGWPRGRQCERPARRGWPNAKLVSPSAGGPSDSVLTGLQLHVRTVHKQQPGRFSHFCPRLAGAGAAAPSAAHGGQPQG